VAHEHQFKLPLLVSTPGDLARLIRELAAVDEELISLGLRAGGREVKLPKTSLLLEQSAAHNKLNLLLEADRKQLLEFLRRLDSAAPRLHISFSADPAPAVMEKLMTFLRQEIDSRLLVTIGLQPTLGAGCIVRGNSKLFDFSLREDFARKRSLLAEQLKLPEAPA
jgi:F0F1-type ATP synthase delta subunit